MQKILRSELEHLDTQFEARLSELQGSRREESKEKSIIATRLETLREGLTAVVDRVIALVAKRAYFLFDPYAA